MTQRDQDFTITSGDVINIRYTTTDVGDEGPLDLTLVTGIQWQASRVRADGTFSSTPKISKDLDSGVQILDAAGGVVLITLEPQDTAGLKGDYYTELQVEFASGPYTVATGKMTVIKDLIS